ncbi:MAG: hypothetical protein WC876_04525 [Candidatus Thermoplasmatota archaeon]|jgi:hypothetical protein
MAASRPPRPSRSFEDDTEAAAGLNATALAGIVLFVVGGFLAAQLAMSALAAVLPGYLADLGTIFSAIAAINTTTWPPIVATMFGFLPIVLGVIAIAALFGAGALLAVGFTRGRGTTP